MAALNHVCMWSEHGWVRVTAEEASRLHPGGTVSAHSGLFMCELCGQYVTLTEGYEKIRHFRHSAFEESKNCPERTFGPYYTPIYKANEHELPIRLIRENNGFHLELGFLYVPQDVLGREKIQSITIKAAEATCYTYSFERLNESTITYLPVGNVPCEKYEVSSPERLTLYWPRSIKGVSRRGSLFDMQTGKMLTIDSDALLYKQYYLLTTRSINYCPSSISASLLHEVRSGWDNWRLYLIEATALDQDAAKFFLSLHYRLTDLPLQIFPLWPLHIRTPYVIKHSDDYLIVHLLGRREKRVTTFPNAAVRSQICSKCGQISKIDCNGRQQLISSGQANVLQYLYFWRETLAETGESPKFQVQDINGSDISSGQHIRLPAQETIKILLPYDGKAIIRRNGVVIERREIAAQTYCTIDKISLGTEIEIRIGLDTVWTAFFKRDKENEFYKDIQACTECGWFGLDEDHVDACPFCGNTELKYTRQMLRPWGFAPRDGEAIPDAQLSEEYTAVQQPLYSTLPDADEMQPILGWKKVRIASRKNQRIIMMNKGSEDHGFMVCKDCGAAFPGNDSTVLDDIRRPYKSKYLRGPCKHNNTINVNLGYDFVTDMLVIEFALDDSVIDTHRKDNPWLNRAAQSFAEALRLTASKELDIEFTELVTGYRLRSNSLGSFLDVYLYDSLSSGAGYAVSVAEDIQKLLAGVENLLASCDCENACHKCLKHYRNQYVHGLLDRSAAIQLLRWGRDGVIAPPLSFNRQKALLLPLSHILEESKCPIFISDNSISTKGAGNEKEIIIYPAMWVEPRDNKKIYVSDAYLRYAKPYAVRKIEHEMKHSTALN